MFYVYVICSLDSELYVGYTSDLEQRICQHNTGQSKSTKGKTWKLVYYEAYASKQDAINREQMLKQRGQAKRHLKERIQNSIDFVCVELSAR